MHSALPLKSESSRRICPENKRLWDSTGREQREVMMDYHKHMCD